MPFDDENSYDDGYPKEDSFGDSGYDEFSINEPYGGDGESLMGIPKGILGSLAIHCSCDNVKEASILKFNLESIFNKKTIALVVGKKTSTIFETSQVMSRMESVPIIILINDSSETQEDCSVAEQGMNADSPIPICIINTYGKDGDFSFRQAITFVNNNIKSIKDREDIFPTNSKNDIDSFLNFLGQSMSSYSMILSVTPEDLSADGKNPSKEIQKILEKATKEMSIAQKEFKDSQSYMDDL